MPEEWGNGKKIPAEATYAVVQLAVGSINGYKVGDTVYTWPGSGEAEPVIPWVAGREV